MVCWIGSPWRTKRRMQHSVHDSVAKGRQDDDDVGWWEKEKKRETKPSCTRMFVCRKTNTSIVVAAATGIDAVCCCCDIPISVIPFIWLPIGYSMCHTNGQSLLLATTNSDRQRAKKRAWHCCYAEVVSPDEERAHRTTNSTNKLFLARVLCGAVCDTNILLVCTTPGMAVRAAEVLSRCQRV